MKRKLVGGLLALAVVLVGVWFFFLRGHGKAADDAAKDPARSAQIAAKPGGAKPGDPANRTPIVPRWSMDLDPEGPLRMEGQVVDADGHGVGGADVWLSSVPPRSTKSEADGGFAFDKLVGRQYSVTAKSGDQTAGPAQYHLAEKSDPLVLHLVEGASVNVTVLDEQKHPLKGANVQAAEIAERTVQTDENGKAKLKPVRPGWVIVIARAQGFAPNTAFTTVGSSGAVGDVSIVLKKGVPVAGRVLDENGKPVTGAHVSVSSPFDFGAGGSDDAVTNAKGEFELAAVSAGSQILAATDGEHMPGRSAPITVNDKAVSGIEIRMKAGGSVTGTVVTADGHPVGFATVRISAMGRDVWGGGGAYRQTTANEKGVFEVRGLARAKQQLRAETDTAASKIANIDLVADVAVKDLKLVLDVSGTISGIVVDDAGAPVPEVQVNGFPDVLGGASQEAMALAGMSSATTDGGGNFALHGLPDGQYRLSVARRQGGFGDWAEHGVSAKPGDKNVRITLAASGMLVGRISIEGQSTPPTLVTVQLGYQAPVSAVDGAFTLKEVAPGTYSIVVRGPDFAQFTKSDVKIDPGKTTDLGTLTVPRGRRLTGHVVDAGGTPVAGARVKVGQMLFSLQGAEDKAEQFENMAGIHSATTDQDGAFTIVGVPPRSSSAMADEPTKGQSLPVSVPPGTDDPPPVTLALRGFGSITGKVTRKGEPQAGVTITDAAKGTTGAATFAQTDADGNFTLSRSTEGPHTLQAMKASMLAMRSASITVQVTAGKATPVTIDMPVGPITLSVQIRAVAGAKVDNAFVHLVPAGTSFANGKQLFDAFFQGSVLGREMWSAGMTAVQFTELMPGDYQICSLPITGNAMDPRLEQEGELLKVYCVPAKVGSSPTTQVLSQELPAMVPLPPAGSGSGSASK